MAWHSSRLHLPPASPPERQSAAQVCDASKVRRSKDGVPIEAAVTANMAHANVVRTIAHATALAEPGSSLSGARSMAVDCTSSVSSHGSPNPTLSALSPRAGRAAVVSPRQEQFFPAEPVPAPMPECWLLLEYMDCGSLMVRAAPALIGQF